jgi:hypothetical protein
LAHDTEDHGQAQPRTLADLLRCEERLEGVVDHLGAHTGSGIGHRHEDTVMADDLLRHIIVAGMDICRFDQENAAPRHGVARIDGDVQERRLNLTGIDQGRPQRTRESMANFNSGPDGSAQEVGDLDDDRVEVSQHGLEVLLASESEQ